MLNEAPGSPNKGILSFQSGFHGRLFGSLSTSRTKALHKVDMPAFDWPSANPPKYKYPIEEHVEHNKAQDDASLEHVASQVARWRSEKGCETVGVIIEPILSEGGDLHISSDFAQRLQAWCKENDIAFIVDEVQTGVAQTGKQWGHDHWDLPYAPNYVTFAKKMLSCGVYYTEDLKMATPFRHFNTFMGDPARAVLTNSMLKMVEEDNLAELAIETGEHLTKGLNALAEKHPIFI
jgi:4-aminobutyrate aminotransferase/(S)-3-amino-2-methylpropionate transaminase